MLTAGHAIDELGMCIRNNERARRIGIAYGGVIGADSAMTFEAAAEQGERQCMDLQSSIPTVLCQHITPEAQTYKPSRLAEDRIGPAGVQSRPTTPNG